MTGEFPTVRTVATPFWEGGELERCERCFACGERAFRTVYRDLEDLLGGLPGRWNFESCMSCESLHLDPRPTSSAISKAYPDSYVTHTDGVAANSRDAGAGLVWRLANDYLNVRFGLRRTPVSLVGRWLIPLVRPLKQQLDYFFRHLPRTPGRLLDVGCGNGAFMLRAQEAGWEVEGIDPDPRAADSSRSAGLVVSAATIEAFEPTQLYDRITLSHVFEHLHDPAAALRRCMGWLRPGGEIWMSLPNPTGWGRRMYGRSWFSLDPPRHLFLPPPDVVLTMLVGAGFKNPVLLARGRGARSSIMPSVQYAARRGGVGSALLGRTLAAAIDVASSFYPRAAEEIVVVAQRGA